jgi:hypothetical protein
VAARSKKTSKNTPGTKSTRKAVSPWPSFEQRRAQFLSRVEELHAQGIEPNPLSQYLVSEVIVTGVFETDRGVGAFILALPTGNTFFARGGTTLYNGRVAAVSTGSQDGIPQVQFVERQPKGGEQVVFKRVQDAPVPPVAEPPAPTAPVPAEKTAPKSTRPAAAADEPAAEEMDAKAAPSRKVRTRKATRPR